MDVSFSVIVPFYNASRYLPRCINSVLSQEYNKFELILVDDGSTDDGNDICKKYACSHNSIRLITQINKGAYAARQTGINACTGEFCVFLDSDDELKPYALKYLAETVERYNPDCICFGLDYVCDDKVLTSNIVSVDEYLDDAKKALYYLYVDKNINSLCIKSCRSLLAKTIVCEQKISYGEDLFFSSQLFQKCTSFYFMAKSLYIYHQISSSAMHTYSLNRIESIAWVWREIYEQTLYKEFFSDSETKELIKKILTVFVHETCDYIYSVKTYSSMKADLASLFSNAFYKKIVMESQVLPNSKKLKWILRCLRKKSFLRLFIVLKIRKIFA